jgi:hypothetical protein
MTPKTDRAAFLKVKVPEYRKNAALFAKEVLQFTPDEWQRNVLLDLSANDRVSVRSGQGVGKTGVEAIAALWFLACFPFARVVATAPTKQQLNDILWAEIAKWQGKSAVLSEILTWTKTYIYIKGYEKRWFAVARTATKPENMQGFHEDNMLFIVDEASGVADPIMEAVLGTLSGDNNKLLMCGNPTKLSGVFFDSHTRDRALYKVHRVNAEDSVRTNKDNIASLKRKYGADSNFVRVRVLGEFPLQEDDVFIPLSLVDGSIQAGRDYVQSGVPESIHIGCDVARFGDDQTVIGYKIDAAIQFAEKRRGQDTMKTADKIIALGESLAARYKCTDKIPVKIDDGGVGGGVVDRLRQIKMGDPERFKWLEIFPVKFGARIKNKHYHDSTSYMTGIVRKLLMPFDEQGGPKPIELILPDDDNLAAQLSCRKYRMTETSKIQIESKDVMKKRGLTSPDEADCVLLCCLPVRLKK